MIHKMDLWHESFEKIKSKSKTIELRLNDEKRALIKVGDIIEFTDTSNDQKLRCTVLELYRYADFETLYRKHDKLSIGYQENESADPADMLAYYSADKINKYGVVGIEIKVINETEGD